MMLNSFVLLAWVVFSTIFATAADELVCWQRAALALQFQLPENVREANAEVKGKAVPVHFFRSQPKRGEHESEADFKNRLLAPALLSRVGWEGALFLMASEANIHEFFGGPATPGPIMPLALKREREKTQALVSKCFGGLETAAEKGKLGVVLYFLHPTNRTDDGQYNFTKGFFKHCQTKGYIFSDFSKYVWHHPELFFSDHRPGYHAQLQTWRATCFVRAFAFDLKTHNLAFAFEYEKPEETALAKKAFANKQLALFQKLSLTTEHVNELYVGLAKHYKYDLMDVFLAHLSWPRPSVAAENYALELALQVRDYARAKIMLTTKPGKKPEQSVLDASVSKDARDGRWTEVGSALREVYGGTIVRSQELTDNLYVCAAAYANEEYIALLTTGVWPHRPSQAAKNDAFVHVCMNNRMDMVRRFADQANGDAFDRGLTEAVKYLNQALFDMLFTVYARKLSSEGMHAALKQAGLPGQQRSRSLFSFIELDNSEWSDNHYEKCLRNKLGLPPKNPFKDKITTLLLKDYLPEVNFEFKRLELVLLKPEAVGDGAAAASASASVNPPPSLPDAPADSSREVDGVP